MSRGGFGAYGGSKALAALTTVELAHRTAADPSAPAVHLVDPGGANTSLVQPMTDGMSTPAHRTLFRLFGPGRRSPATAARSSVVGAAASDLDGHSGRWVGAGGRIARPPRRLTDLHLRREAWELTRQRVGIDQADLPGGIQKGPR